MIFCCCAHYWYSEVRIVNVSNAGTVTGRWSSQEMRAAIGNKIGLISANITSWKQQGRKILALQPDIMALQEIRLNHMEQVKAQVTLGCEGKEAKAGKASNRKMRAGGKKSQWATGDGGVLVAVKAWKLQGLLQAGSSSQEGAVLYQQSRYVRTAIPIKVKGKVIALHVVSLYNLADSSEAASIIKERNNARMFEDLEEAMGQPVLICADTNQKESAVIAAAIATGSYVDVGLSLAGPRGPQETYCVDKDWKGEKRKGATRPDKIFANRAAWEMITKFKVLPDTGIPGHRAIYIELEGEEIDQQQTALDTPIALDVEAIKHLNDVMRKRQEEIVLNQYEDVIKESREEKNVNKAWKKTSAMAERYLKRCIDCTTEGKNSPTEERGGKVEYVTTGEVKESKDIREVDGSQRKKSAWRPVEEVNKRGKRKQPWYDRLETRVRKLANKNEWVEKKEEEQKRDDEAYVDRLGMWQCSDCESRQHVIQKECEQCEKTRDVMHTDARRAVDRPVRKRKKTKGPGSQEDKEYTAERLKAERYERRRIRDNKAMLQKCEVLEEWRKVRYELKRYELPCKELANTVVPDEGKLKWALNLVTAKGTKMTNQEHAERIKRRKKKVRAATRGGATKEERRALKNIMSKG